MGRKEVGKENLEGLQAIGSTFNRYLEYLPNIEMKS